VWPTSTHPSLGEVANQIASGPCDQADDRRAPSPGSSRQEQVPAGKSAPDAARPGRRRGTDITRPMRRRWWNPVRCGRHSGGCAGRRYRIPRSGRHSVFRMRFGDNFGG